MVIGFDGSRAFVNKRTGTENYSYQLLKSLSLIDHKNKYIVYLRPGNNPGKDWPNNFLFKEIKWPRLWTQGGLAIQTFKDKLDVLFIPAHTSPLFHRPGLKTVVTVHDLGAEYLPQLHQLKQRLYLNWVTIYLLKNATKLIAVSKATKDDLINKIGIDLKKIEVVYEGYDKDKFKIQNSKIKNSVQAKDYYLFVGTVQPRKNLARLIKAMVEISGNLVIAGSKGWDADAIYALPKKLGIEKRIKFLGYVPDQDLPGLYSEAEAFVFPSLFEGFGLPILEAQASGCPVLTSNLSSMSEVAGKGAVYVNPYSVESIIEGMKSLQSTANRLQLIKKGLENVKKFSWENCAKETLKVLESV